MSTFEIFPTPSVVPPSQISPTVWPGVTPVSTAKLVDVLKDNHRKWNIFFNDRGFTNHITHHALAVWALGAPAPVITAAYKYDTGRQRPLPKISIVITEENWVEHLGNVKLFAAYTKFFKDVVEQNGINAAVEKYIFSREANFDAKHEGKQPQMLTRFFEGLFHSVIHVGYGYQFSLPGMVIEGLAQAALHPTSLSALVTASHWNSIPSSLTEKITSSLWLDGATAAAPSHCGPHVFTILARMAKDSQFDAGIGDLLENYLLTAERHGTAISSYADQWSLNLADPGELDRKIEELQWMGAMLYGIAGWSKNELFNADFDLMHLATSSLFLPDIVSNLSSTSQALLLRKYLAFSLLLWVSRGRPALDIKGFMVAATSHPLPPKKLTPPDYHTLLISGDSFVALPNPWTAIIEMSITNPDDHLAKLQRGLAHYSRLYGTRVAGLPDFSESGLEGAEKLDGTLFIRVAGLTFRRVVAEKDPEKSIWDRRGFQRSQ